MNTFFQYGIILGILLIISLIVIINITSKTKNDKN